MNIELRRRRNPPRGLTLIELLIAIAITVLLVGVVGLIYGSALNTLRVQAAERAARQPAAEALATLQRDLRCALAPRGTTNPPFLLMPGDAGAFGAFRLHLFTARPGGGSNDWRAYGIHEVEYTLQAAGATGDYALVRQGRSFRTTDLLFKPGAEAPAAPGAEIILSSLAVIRLLVYDGKTWTNTWAAADALPQAARITLQLNPPAGPRTISSETLIPAGHTIRASGGTKLSRADAPKKSI